MLVNMITQQAQAAREQQMMQQVERQREEDNREFMRRLEAQNAKMEKEHKEMMELLRPETSGRRLEAAVQSEANRESAASIKIDLDERGLRALAGNAPNAHPSSIAGNLQFH